jgi:hypothetical protein
VSPGAANTYLIRSTSSAGSGIASRAARPVASAKMALSQANWLSMVRTASSTGRKRGDSTDSVV